MKKIIIAGSLNTDLVINAPYAPRGGETIMGSGFMENSGGKGANQATAVAKLGGQAYMCGCIGADGFGDTLINNLKNQPFRNIKLFIYPFKKGSFTPVTADDYNGKFHIS